MGPKHETEATGCDDLSEEACRPLRADALRNRARVLDAAEAVFAEQGISVPVDVIAEKAGVGVGTLYRHFPTKEKLFEAVLVDRMIGIAADARARLDAEDPGAAFFGFLAHLVEQSASKRDLFIALSGAGIEFEVACAEAKAELTQAVQELLQVAQRAGAVRSDVGSEVVLSLISATCFATEQHPTTVSSQDILAVVCDGLRAPSAPA